MKYNFKNIDRKLRDNNEILEMEKLSTLKDMKRLDKLATEL